MCTTVGQGGRGKEDKVKERKKQKSRAQGITKEEKRKEEEDDQEGPGVVPMFVGGLLVVLVLPGPAKNRPSEV